MKNTFKNGYRIPSTTIALAVVVLAAIVAAPNTARAGPITDPLELAVLSYMGPLYEGDNTFPTSGYPYLGTSSPYVPSFELTEPDGALVDSSNGNYTGKLILDIDYPLASLGNSIYMTTDTSLTFDSSQLLDSGGLLDGVDGDITFWAVFKPSTPILNSSGQPEDIGVWVVGDFGTNVKVFAFTAPAVPLPPVGLTGLALIAGLAGWMPLRRRLAMCA